MSEAERPRLVMIEDTLWQRIERLAERKGIPPADAISRAIQIDEMLVSPILDRDETICVLPRDEAEHVDELRYNSWLRENAPERKEQRS